MAEAKGTSRKDAQANRLHGLPTGLSALLEPSPGALADIRDKLGGIIDNPACAFFNSARGLADFGDGLFGFSAPLSDLHVAFHDNDSAFPVDRPSSPFHALRNASRRFGLPDSAPRLPGDGMTTSVQQGQADNQPRQHARLEPDLCRGAPRDASHCLSAPSSLGSSTAASSGQVSHTCWPAPPIRSRDLARFGSATETGSSRPSR